MLGTLANELDYIEAEAVEARPFNAARAELLLGLVKRCRHRLAHNDLDDTDRYEIRLTIQAAKSEVGRLKGGNAVRLIREGKNKRRDRQIYKAVELEFDIRTAQRAEGASRSQILDRFRLLQRLPDGTRVILSRAGWWNAYHRGERLIESSEGPTVDSGRAKT